MGPLLGAAAISGGSSLLGGLFGGIGRRRRERRQNQAQERLMNQQYDRQLDMWNKQWERETAYNDPKAQMERLKKAGINPHMAYQSGGINNTATAGELPKYQAPQYQEPITGGEVLGSGLGEFINSAAQVMNLKLTQNQIRKSEEEITTKQLANDLMKSSTFDRKKAQDSASYQKALSDYNIYTGATPSSDYEKSQMSKLGNVNIQNEIMKLQKQGLLSDNEVKAYRARLAKAEIDPDSNPLIREVMKAMAASGVPLNTVIQGLVKSIMK